MGRSSAFAFSAALFGAGLCVPHPAFSQSIPHSMQVSDDPQRTYAQAQRKPSARYCSTKVGWHSLTLVSGRWELP